MTEGDPTSYEEAMRSPYSSKWVEAMEDEMKSMSSNNIWDLEEIPKGAKTVGCKDSFRIIMALVAHFDLELHQMDVKTALSTGI